MTRTDPLPARPAAASGPAEAPDAGPGSAPAHAPARTPARTPAAAPRPRHLYLAWIGFQRRAASMAEALDLDLHHVPPPFAAKRLKPLGYLVQAARSWRILRAARPDIVWVQTPQTFLVHLLLAARAVLRPRFRLVVDAHNGTLIPPWSRFPGAVAAINRADLVLVHNAEARDMAEALGIDPSRLDVLEDAPPRLAAPAPAAPADPAARPVADPAARPVVLVPCSFGADEPVPVLLEAARLLPEADIRITGSRAKAEAKGFPAAAPPNVAFTGYLPLDAFERLLAGAAVVLGLTDREGVQLSVANEALGAGRALVLSDTRILRGMFGEAALLARNEPAALAAALREAIARRAELEARSAGLRARRQHAWRAESARAVARAEADEPAA